MKLASTLSARVASPLAVPTSTMPAMARANPRAKGAGAAGREPRASMMRAQNRGAVAAMAPTAVALVKVRAMFSSRK
jgi:hypothetical protein